MRDKKGDFYALKEMKKAHIAAVEQVEHVVQEKKLLQSCAHPAIVKYEACYQDEHSIYLLLEVRPPPFLHPSFGQQHSLPRACNRPLLLLPSATLVKSTR